MTPNEAYMTYNRALRHLMESIREAYGKDLDGFLPEVLLHLDGGKPVLNPAHILHLVSNAMRVHGVPPISGEPYQMRMTTPLLSNLIIANGWLPSHVPLLATGKPPGGSVDDALQRAREAEAEVSAIRLAVKTEASRAEFGGGDLTLAG